MKIYVEVAKEQIICFEAQLRNENSEKSLHRFLRLMDGQTLDCTYLDLRNMDLSGADLRHARFNSADLRNTNLSNAELSETIFCHANLQGANLSYAIFYMANLTFADCSNADFTGARLTQIKCGLTNFIGTKGLDVRWASNIHIPKELLPAVQGKKISYDIGYRYAKSLWRLAVTEEDAGTKNRYTQAAQETMDEIRKLPLDKQPTALKRDIATAKTLGIAPLVILGGRSEASLFSFLPKELHLLILMNMLAVSQERKIERIDVEAFQEVKTMYSTNILKERLVKSAEVRQGI